MAVSSYPDDIWPEWHSCGEFNCTLLILGWRVNQNCLKERQKILEAKKSGRLNGKPLKDLSLVNNFFKIATVVCW